MAKVETLLSDFVWSASLIAASNVVVARSRGMRIVPDQEEELEKLNEKDAKEIVALALRIGYELDSRKKPS